MRSSGQAQVAYRSQRGRLYAVPKFIPLLVAVELFLDLRQSTSGVWLRKAFSNVAPALR